MHWCKTGCGIIGREQSIQLLEIKHKIKLSAGTFISN